MKLDAGDRTLRVDISLIGGGFTVGQAGAIRGQGKVIRVPVKRCKLLRHIVKQIGLLTFRCQGDLIPADFLVGIWKDFCTQCFCQKLGAKTDTQNDFIVFKGFGNKFFFRRQPCMHVFFPGMG